MERKQQESDNALDLSNYRRLVKVSQLAAGGSSSETDIQNKLIEICVDRDQQRQITRLIKQKLDKILNDTPEMREIWREKLAKEATIIEKNFVKTQKQKQLVDLRVSTREVKHRLENQKASKNSKTSLKSNSKQKLVKTKSKLEIRNEKEQERLSKLSEEERYEEFKTMLSNSIPTFKLK